MKIIVYKNYTDMPDIARNTGVKLPTSQDFAESAVNRFSAGDIPLLLVPIVEALKVKPKNFVAVTFMGEISKDEVNQVKTHWGMHR